MNARFLLTISLLLIFCLPADAQFGRRRRMTPNNSVRLVRIDDGQMSSTTIAAMPYPRSNLAAVAWHDRIYLIGGNDSDGATNNMWVFDPYTRQFDSMPPLLEARLGHGAILCGHRLLVFGGIGEHDSALSSIEAFDLQTRTWSRIGEMPFTRARFGMAAADGRVWLAGGTDAHDPSSDFYSYDPVHGTWQRKADLPQARDRLALATLHGDIYAIGGENGDGKSCDTVWRYELGNDRWVDAPRLKAARRSLTATRLGDTLVVAGGMSEINSEKVFLPQIEVYDPKTNEWISHGHLDWVRDGCHAVTWRGRVMIFGGYKSDYISSVEETQWRPRASEWRVDDSLRGHLLSLFEHELPAATAAEDAHPLSPSSAAAADVKGMGLADGRALGIPLPGVVDEAHMGIFLKYYQYPSQLAQEASVRRLISPFLVGGTAGPAVAADVSGHAGVVVEKLVVAPANTSFSSTHPFPALRIPTENVDALSPQDFFDSSLLFASIYVRAASPHPPGAAQRGTAAASAQGATGDDAEREKREEHHTPTSGIAAFSTETLTLLAHAYRAVSGPDPMLVCFVDDSELDQLGDDPVYTLIRIPRQPQVFTDWQERALPGSATPTFLNGRVLLRADAFTLPTATEITDLRNVNPHVIHSSAFEVASVVRQRSTDR